VRQCRLLRSNRHTLPVVPGEVCMVHLSQIHGSWHFPTGSHYIRRFMAVRAKNTGQRSITPRTAWGVRSEEYFVRARGVQVQKVLNNRTDPSTAYARYRIGGAWRVRARSAANQNITTGKNRTGRLHKKIWLYTATSAAIIARILLVG